MLLKKRFVLSLCSAFFFLFSAHVPATMIDLNDFLPSYDPAVSVSVDGVSADFTESAIFSPISLTNMSLHIPADAYYLMFDYELMVAPNNVDYFDFYLNDLTRPHFSVGGYVGTTAGTFSTDISSFTDMDLALVFALSYDWGDGGLDSVLSIRNLEITQRVVPVTTTYLLMMIGLFGMLVIKRSCIF